MVKLGPCNCGTKNEVHAWSCWSYFGEAVEQPLAPDDEWGTCSNCGEGVLFSEYDNHVCKTLIAGKA